MMSADTIIPELQNKVFKVLNFMPTSFRTRDEKARYEKILNEYEKYLKSRADEIMDALTDGVKDFITPDEIKRIDEKIRQIFEDKMSIELFNRLKSVENSLSSNEKLSVMRGRLNDLKGEITKLRSELLSKRWKEIDEAQGLTLLSQVLYLSESIIDRVLNDIDRKKSDSLKEINIMMGISLYLLLKFMAMVKKKVTIESLVYALSSVQVFLDYYEVASFT